MPKPEDAARRTQRAPDRANTREAVEALKTTDGWKRWRRHAVTPIAPASLC